MRILTAVVTAVAFLALGASLGLACDGKRGDQTAKDGSAYYPPADSS